MASVRFPVYQIDFASQAAGKRVASTKRRIRWRFGFPNKQALDGGQKGVECRGEEHDITVVWSITSGKRNISMDGREVHYSSSRAGVLDFSWTTKGNHVIKVICHAAAPLSPEPGFRQYDLLVDGQSFFNMPKVYELGIRGPIPSHARVPGAFSNPTSPISMDSGYNRPVGDYGPSSREEEEAALRMAIQASLEESRQHLSGPGAGGSVAPTTNLLDFGSPPPSGPPQYPQSDARSVSGMSYYSAPPSYSPQPQAYGAPAPYQSPAGVPPPNPAPSPQAAAYGAIVPAHAPPGSYYQAPPTTPSYSAGAPQPTYAPSPVPPQANYQASPAPPAPQSVFGFNSMPGEDPFAPKPPPPPTPQDYTNAILEAYKSPAPITPTAGGGTPVANGQPSPETNGTPSQHLSMNALTNTATDEAPVSDFDRALKNLVNFDHIDEPAEGEIKLTMIKKEEIKKKQAKDKSVPLPPVAKSLVGSGATLSQIKGTKHNERTLKETPDGVMNAPPPGVFSPGAAGGGAMVVFGQGPPPLHQPTGFGLGARLPNGGFSHQQQGPPIGYQQQYR